MAEAQNSTAITSSVLDGEYIIEAREFDTTGKITVLKAGLPTVPDFSKWTVMQQVVMLKKSAWSKSPVSEIVFALAYANRLGLDVMRGDVFPTGEGRLGISNKAKIKLALQTGNVIGIETDLRDTGEPLNLVGCAVKNDLECTATIHVKGWAKPIVRKARLSRWYKAKNPNWVGNPEHMLELNTVAHALEYVNPTATQEDEFIPTIDAQLLDKGSAVDVALEKAKEQVVATETEKEK